MSAPSADVVTDSVPKRSRLGKASFILGGIPALGLGVLCFAVTHYPSSFFVDHWINDLSLMRPVFILFGALGCAAVAFGIAAIIRIATSRVKVCGWDIALLGILMGSIGVYSMRAMLGLSKTVM